MTDTPTITLMTDTPTMPCPNAWETDSGDWIWCQLLKGHDGDHLFEWDNSEGEDR